MKRLIGIKCTHITTILYVCFARHLICDDTIDMDASILDDYDRCCDIAEMSPVYQEPLIASMVYPVTLRYIEIALTTLKGYVVIIDDFV